MADNSKPNKNDNIWKWVSRILIFILIAIVSWVGTEVWSNQKDVIKKNIQQDSDIRVLQNYIISNDKILTDIKNNLIEREKRDDKRDSVLQDLSLKINIMFDGR